MVDLSGPAAEARAALDAHVREIVNWHFDPETGCPYWLDRAKTFDFDPRKDIQSFADLKRFPPFDDEDLRGGPMRRWVPKAYADSPIFVFETGGTTGTPKSRIVIDDFRIDYELFSQTIPDEYFPPGSNWLMLGPSGPRRLRLAVEHLCQFRGGICFCIDLDPRWVIKLIKKGWMEHLEAYKSHCIQQALTILDSGPPKSSSVANRVHCGVNSVPPEKIPVIPTSAILLPRSSSASASASSSFGVANKQRIS